MSLGDFITPDAPASVGPKRLGQHFRYPEFISHRIKMRGDTEWAGDNLLEAAMLWRDGKTKTEIAAHFSVTRDSIVGMMFRNRALFPRRKGHIEWRATTQAAHSDKQQ